MSDVQLYCWVCEKGYLGPEPQSCCNGRECGCMGLPLEPIVCSSECYDLLVLRKYYKRPGRLQCVGVRVIDLKEDDDLTLVYQTTTFEKPIYIIQEWIPTIDLFDTPEDAQAANPTEITIRKFLK